MEILAGEPGLRDIRPQIPGLRIPSRDNSYPHPALYTLTTESDLHRCYKGKEIGGDSRNQEGIGDWGQER